VHFVVCVIDYPRLRPLIVSTDGVLRDRQLLVHENTAVNLTCEVDAIPSPSQSTFSWYRNGSLVHTGQYYAMEAVQRRDAAQFECQVSNTLTPSDGQSQTGTGRAVFNLVVMCKHLFPLHARTQTNTYARTHAHSAAVVTS